MLKTSSNKTRKMRHLEDYIHRAALIFIFTAGAFVRLYDLGTKSLWRDEIETLFFSLPSFKEIIRRSLEIPFIPIPPLYFFITHFFLKINSSPLFLRLPASLFSIISLFLIYYYGRRLFGRRIALLSLYLLAISPFQIYYAQEARSYSFLMMISLLSMIFLEKGINDSLVWFVPWTMACLAVLYTHHFGIFIVFIEIFLCVYFFWRGVFPSRSSRKSCFAVLFVSVIFIFSLWLPMCKYLLSGLTGSRGVNGLSLKSSFSLEEMKTMIGLAGLGSRYGAMIMPIIGLIGCLLFPRKDKKGLIVSLSWLLPAAGIILFGRFGHAFRVRYLIFAIPFYLIVVSRGSHIIDGLISNGLRKLIRKKSVITFIPFFTMTFMSAAAAWVGPFYSGYYQEEKQNWKASIAFIKKTAGDEDLILVSGRGEETNLRRFIVDYYGGLGSRTRILHTSRDYSHELLNLLKSKRPLWYISTEPLKHASKRENILMDGELKQIIEDDYTILPSIFFGTNTRLTDLEAKYLAPFRFKRLNVTAFLPINLSDKEALSEYNRLLGLARSIPRSYIETDRVSRLFRINTD